MMDISDLRQEYSRHHLTEANVLANPIEQFTAWLHQALQAQVPEPNAMTLATVSAQGQPSARIVLLKEVRPQGLVFFTNYHSRKAQEMEHNPLVAVVFLWLEIERQVRVEGRVVGLPASESDSYFAERPTGSQLGAWASPQSQVVPHRQHLQHLMDDCTARYAHQPIPRPPHWGGYLLQPTMVELWQGRPSRLHDRLRYSLQPTGQWAIERLAP